MPTHPEVLWAQRSSATDEEKNVIYLTVNIPDIDESTLDYQLTPSGINLKATAGSTKTDYAFSLDFFEEIVPEKSTSRLTTRSFVATLRKKEVKAEYWPRLTKVKTPFVRTDFSKWVDEDEQDGGGGGFNDDDIDGMGGMSGMGGMPGMGGDMDFEKMMASMGGAGAHTGEAGEADEVEAGSDSDDDGPPPLEDAEPAA
ncbi:HSP20-like chaperone [Scleroderma yunnanense]